LGLLSFRETPELGVLFYEILFELIESAVPDPGRDHPVVSQVIGQFFSSSLSSAEALLQRVRKTSTP